MGECNLGGAAAESTMPGGMVAPVCGGCCRSVSNKKQQPPQTDTLILEHLLVREDYIDDVVIMEDYQP